MIITRELRGIPDWVLQEYLESLGGKLQSEGCYQGDGWQARFTPLESIRYGPMEFCRFQVEFEGEPDVLPKVWKRFELKIMRPGG